MAAPGPTGPPGQGGAAPRKGGPAPPPPWGGPAGTGGPGPDDLWGGPGSDVLLGSEDEGAGTDATADDDRLNGGTGTDRLTYASRRLPVAVDLAARRGGSAGEHDVLFSLENVTAGFAGDTIRGDDKANLIDVGPVGPTIPNSGERVDGRAGPDTILGSEGSSMAGGSGNDRIFAAYRSYYDTLLRRREVPFRALCGSGGDRLYPSGVVDALPPATTRTVLPL